MYIYFINISQKIRLVIDNRIPLGLPSRDFLSTPLAYHSMRFSENAGCKVLVCKFSWPTLAVYSIDEMDLDAFGSITTIF